MNQDKLFKINHPKLILFVQGLVVTVGFIAIMLIAGLNGK
jgi:hypothetical protein